MFQFSGLAPARKQVTGLVPDGLPHSDISGSSLLGRSPELLAAVHVLRRLHKPRHPPCALAYFLLSCLAALRCNNISYRCCNLLRNFLSLHISMKWPKSRSYSFLNCVKELFRAPSICGTSISPIIRLGTEMVRYALSCEC